MNDQDTIQEFEALFAQDAPPAEDTPPEADPPETPPVVEAPETPPGEETPPEEDEETPPAPEGTKTPESKTNYTMAKLRTEKNQYESLIRNLGTQLKLDPKLSTEEIAAEIARINTERTAEKYNLPVELAERLNQTDSILRDNAINSKYIKVNATLDGMRQKYGYDQAVEDELLQTLINEGKHPLNPDIPDVDLEAEFLKRNVDIIIKQQREQAAAAERTRLQAADNAPAGLPGQSPGAPAEGDKIETVEGLDAYFEKMLKANS